MDYITINISSYFNNNGIYYNGTDVISDFTGFGSSYPSDELNSDGGKIEIEGIPFLFPCKGQNSADNIELYYQEIEIPLNNYKTIYILGASENGSFKEDIKLKGTKGLKYVKLGLTDWIEKYPLFGESIACRCKKLIRGQGEQIQNMNPTIWLQKIPLPDEKYEFNRIEFNDNPSMHVFALTLLSRG